MISEKVNGSKGGDVAGKALNYVSGCSVQDEPWEKLVRLSRGEGKVSGSGAG